MYSSRKFDNRSEKYHYLVIRIFECSIQLKIVFMDMRFTFHETVNYFCINNTLGLHIVSPLFIAYSHSVSTHFNLLHLLFFDILHRTTQYASDQKHESNGELIYQMRAITTDTSIHLEIYLYVCRWKTERRHFFSIGVEGRREGTEWGREYAKQKRLC